MLTLYAFALRADRAEIEVDKIAIPSDTRKGQPFDATVVLNNLAQPTTEDDGDSKTQSISFTVSSGGDDTGK